MHRIRWLLAGAFIFIIGCEGIIQAVSELRRGDSVQLFDVVRHIPTQDRLRTFEHELESRAWPAVMSRPAMQFIRYSLYDDLGEKAVAGEDGWLFYRPDVDFLIEPWPLRYAAAPLADDPLPAIVAFHDALAARGIQLLVVPAPGKPSVYPDRLSARAIDYGDGAHHRVLFQRLRDAGIPYVDLYQTFAEARAEKDAPTLYLAQDTHWSPAGIRIAAAAIANRLRTEGWAPPGSTAYATRPVTVNRVGDVLRMVDAEAISSQFEPEPIVCEQVVDPSGAPYTDRSDSSILVLGDSFLRIFQRDEPGSAGFIAHLARELGQPLASIVSDGGASTLVRQELQRNSDLLANTTVVVWEFVERDLRFGMEGWKIVSL